jgi:zinc protease
MDIVRYELDNGLKVILQPNRAAPVVACNVWVGVGSADEEPHEAGLAHVHEHMLFKGTERRGVGQIAREVEAAGGHINAFTSFDQTCYYVVMSSRFFESGLDILSDAVRHSAFDADELASELEVIQEEIKRGEDNPSRVASLKLFETAYAEHPYRLPVIGTSESVDSFGREHVVDFFHKHYVPDNVAVVLVGDFDEAHARAEVERCFGDWGRGDGYARVTRPEEPRQERFRAAVLDTAAQDVHLRVGFHIPEMTHEDIPALELLATIVGQGEASPLYQRVQRERELVNGIYTGAYTLRDNGLFVLSADYQLRGEGEDTGATSHEEVARAALSELFAFRQLEVSDEDLLRARTLLESQAIYGKQTVEGLAMKFGHFQMTAGDPTYEETYYALLEQVDAAALREVARRYLTPENCAAVLSHPPEVAGATPDALELWTREAFGEAAGRAADPPEVAAPAPPRPVASGAALAGVAADDEGFAVVEIDGGPTLIVQETRAVEIVSARALTFGGVRMETPETNGSNALLSELLSKGTPTRTAEQLARQVESMASHVGGMSGRNTLGGTLTALSRYLDPCLETLAEILLEATIPEAEFERDRRLHLQELRSRSEQLGAANFDRFAARFFAGHPYAMPTGGTVESVSGLTADALRAYARERLRPEHLTIAVVGDVDAAHVAAKVESLFQGSGGARSGRGELAAPARREGPELVVGDLDKNQAHVIVGYPGPTLDDDDRYALDVLHAVLSGQGGRLFMELRDRQSLAYSVYASMLMGVEASSFMINIGTSPDKIEQALTGMIGEARKMVADQIRPDELADAKRYLIGNHDIGLQRNGARAMSIGLNTLYGLGHRRTFEYGEQIEAVDLAQVQALAARIFDESQLVAAVTKPSDVTLPDDLLARALAR